MSDFNNKLVIDLFEERDALKADVVRLTLKVAELYKGAEEQKQRIQSLIEERDRANRLAEWKWNLRDEFQLLLGTDKIEEGIEAVKELKRRIKRLEEFARTIENDFDHDEDAHRYGTTCRVCDAEDLLKETKAKEAKP